VLVVSGFKLAPRLGVFTVLDLHKMGVLLIGCELTGVPDSGRRLAGWCCCSAESPLSPLHPALLLNAYLGWTFGNFCAFLVGISVTSIASGRLVVGLCIEGNRRGKSHSGTVPLEDPMGICGFCKAKRSLLPISL